MYVYILTNTRRTLYTGVCRNLESRINGHVTCDPSHFARKYNCDKLVFFEFYQDFETAILREKQLKGWNRAKKIALIEKSNPDWFPVSIS
jgi:putative endonuclease